MHTFDLKVHKMNDKEHVAYKLTFIIKNFFPSVIGSSLRNRERQNRILELEAFLKAWTYSKNLGSNPTMCP